MTISQVQQLFLLRESTVLAIRSGGVGNRDEAREVVMGLGAHIELSLQLLRAVQRIDRAWCSRWDEWHRLMLWCWQTVHDGGAVVGDVSNGEQYAHSVA